MKNKLLIISLVAVFIVACGVPVATMSGLQTAEPSQTATIDTYPPTAKAENTATRHFETVIAAFALNVRSSGSEASPVIYTLKHGDRVEILSPCNSVGWVQIGNGGWINADYISGKVCK